MRRKRKMIGRAKAGDLQKAGDTAATGGVGLQNVNRSFPQHPAEITETFLVSRTDLDQYESRAVPFQCAIRFRKISRHGIAGNINALYGYDLIVPGRHLCCDGLS